MSFYNGFGDRPRRGPSLVITFLVGLLGVVIGGALVFGFFDLHLLPSLNDRAEPAPPAEQPASPLPIDPETTIVEVVQKASPAVVGVTNYSYAIWGGQRLLRERSSGSGAIISADGYIVTNQHVIDGADEIEVLLPNSEIVRAALVGEDPLTDLALLKIEKQGLPYLYFGDSSRVQVGETAIAIGNPLKYFQQTVTTGVISAVERQVALQEHTYNYTYLQTDAAINSGNSGGPLVNLRGQIIGINSAKIRDVGVEGIGFAIPSNTVRRVVDDLMIHGEVRRPRLGVSVRNFSTETGVASDKGVFVAEVTPGSPAEQAGLQAGDVIMAIADREVHFTAQLFDALLNYYPGEITRVTVIRDGVKLELSITLGEMV